MPDAPDPALLPLVLLRGTGFAVELVDEAGTPETAAAADALRAARRRLEAYRGHFLEAVFTRAVEQERAAQAPRIRFRQWYRIRRRIERRERVEAGAIPTESAAPEGTAAVETWNRLTDEVAAAGLRLGDTGRAEWNGVWRRLAEIASDGRFGEAVFLSSPSMYRAVRRFVARAQPERDWRTGVQVYGYLQRFTMKNETTSFFGPIDHAVVRTDLADRLRFDAGDGRVGRRWSRVAYWAAQAVADAIGAEGAIGYPRLADGYRIDEAGLLDVLRNRRVRVPADLLAAARRCDGRTPVPESEALAKLAERSVVDRRLRLPTAVDDPLGWLREHVATAPMDPARRDRWLGVIDTLGGFADRFALAAVADKEELLGRAEEVVRTATGTAGIRPGGLYSDRTVLFDEALGDLSVDIGPAMAGDLTARLRPALDLCVTYSLILQDVVRERARDEVRRMGGGRAVPYLAFVRRTLSTVDLAECAADARVGAFLDHLTGAVAATPDGSPARLDPALLPRRAAPPGTGVSPDLFLAAKSHDALAAGEYDLVIGEIHHGVQIWTHLLAFWPDVSGLGETLRAVLPDPDLAATVHMRRQGKAFPRELPGCAVELTGRSTKPGSRVIRAADLDVVPTDDGVEVRHGRRTLRLHPGDPRAAANWVFGPPPVQAPPIRLGRHTPRVTIGGAVLQRETWHVPGAEIAAARRSAPHDALAQVRDLADRVGLPPRWFAKVDGARKPFYVDLTSMVSVQHLLSQVNPAADVRCTELLPDPDSYWLPAAGGGRRGVEWRTSWVYGGAR